MDYVIVECNKCQDTGVTLEQNRHTKEVSETYCYCSNGQQESKNYTTPWYDEEYIY